MRALKGAVDASGNEEREDEAKKHNETPKRRNRLGGGCTPTSPFIRVTWRGAAPCSYNNCGRRTPSRTTDYRSTGYESESKFSRYLLACCSSSSSSSSARSSASGGCALESDLKEMHLLNESNGCSTVRKPTEDATSSSSSSVCRLSSVCSDQKSYSTPNRTSLSRHNPYSNPFESDLIETINCSSLTPSVFSTVLTPNRYKSDDGFCWGVDNVAVLYPAEIEENPQQDVSPRPVDVEMEERLQHAINSFFAQKSFAPSPWLENDYPGPGVRNSPPAPLPPPSDCEAGSTQSSEGGDRKGRSSLGGVVRQNRSQERDVWCQTVLSLPANFQLDRVLAKYFTFCEDQSEQEQEVRFGVDDDSVDEGENIREPLESSSRDGSNLSSLRRKLFANYDREPPSPSRPGHPVCRPTLSPRTQDRSMTTPPIVMASSPIVSVKDPGHRSSMTPPTTIDSPTISPIGSFVLKPDDADVSFMSTGPSCTNTPIGSSKTDQTSAPFYDDDLGVHRQDVSFSEMVDKMGRHPPPPQHTGQTGEVKAERACRVCITLPNTRLAANEAMKATVPLVDIEWANRLLVPHLPVPDLGYQTMSSSQDSGQNASLGVLSRPTCNIGIRSDSASKTALGVTENSFWASKGGNFDSSNTTESLVVNASSSAMMWLPIGASTPSSSARFAATTLESQ